MPVLTLVMCNVLRSFICTWLGDETLWHLWKKMNHKTSQTISFALSLRLVARLRTLGIEMIFSKHAEGHFPVEIGPHGHVVGSQNKGGVWHDMLERSISWNRAQALFQSHGGVPRAFCWACFGTKGKIELIACGCVFDVCAISEKDLLGPCVFSYEWMIL